MKKVIQMALVASTIPMAAFAGGMAQPMTEPMVAVAAPPMMIAPNGDWTGAYSGIILGFGNLKINGDHHSGHEGIAGIDLGYRRDFGSLVAGGELSYTKNDIGAKGGSNQVNYSRAAKLMLGFDMGRTLVYGTVGVTEASVDLAHKRATDNGYLAGIGMDYALTDTWTVGGELLASQYNDFGHTGIDLRTTDLLFKVGYHF